MNRLPNLLAARLPFFYGYVVAILAVLATVCSSPGQTFAISAFTPYFQESLGLSSSKLAAAYMLGTFLAAFPLSAIGPLSDRFGIRKACIGAAIGLSLACFLVSQASGFYTLFLGFLLLRFLGQGAMTLLASNMVSMWFQQRLGRVNAAMSVGGAAAFGIIPVVLVSAIDVLGWRTTYVVMGCAVALLLVPAVFLFFKDRPEEIGLLPDGQAHSTGEDSDGEFQDVTFEEAIRHRTFWIMATALALWALIGTGIVFYAYPIFQQYGIEIGDAKLLFTTFSASMLAGQILGGVMADRFEINRILAIGYLGLFIGALIIPMTQSLLHMHLFALFFGFGQGVSISASATLWVRYYGRTHLGKIRGAVWCSTVAGSGCGPFVLGLFRDWTGTYDLGLWLFALALLPLAPLILWATAPEIAMPSPDADMGSELEEVEETALVEA